MDGAIYPSDDVILDYKLKSVSAIDSINSVTRVFRAAHLPPLCLKPDACSELIAITDRPRALLSYSSGISLLFYLHLPAACLLPSSLLLTNICTNLTPETLTRTRRQRGNGDAAIAAGVPTRGLPRRRRCVLEAWCGHLRSDARRLHQGLQRTGKAGVRLL